jgi:hypothetical protein
MDVLIEERCGQQMSGSLQLMTQALIINIR